jgi:hypothetical protein
MGIALLLLYMKNFTVELCLPFMGAGVQRLEVEIKLGS